ncbi:MAG TPA: diacylglycerol kinase family protein, partial [Verrucomicrobiae bacterium]
MRICVIFNPAARGNKAKRFRRFLNELSQQCALKATSGPGDARRLAQAAVATGYDIVAAAGGDGTVNEVLNGIGDEPGGFERTRLGVLPLGTVNVFARELNIPLKLERAWRALKRANEMKIDLGRADYQEAGKPVQRYFMQLAGCGLDARAVELVSWKLKKTAGPLAYVVAGFQAVAEKQATITATANGQKITGELILLGNGRYYGGPFEIFPEAGLCDGELDACAFPKVDLPSCLRLAPGILFRRRPAEHLVHRLRGS